MRLSKATLLLLSIVMPLTTPAQNKIFPYKYFTDDLPNGLRVITVPTDYPNLVALYIVVTTGSRNEVEPGKFGFAHLFEHLHVRGTEKVSADAYNQALKNAGADSNAYTSDDRTVYHTVFSKEDLDQIMTLEADRFQNLKVPIDLFKTETRAVLGEYNKNASSPVRKIEEALRETAFKSHTYQHTTGLFARRREHAQYVRLQPRVLQTLLPARIRDDHRRRRRQTRCRPADGRQVLGRLERGSYTPEIPSEGEQSKALSTEVAWPTPTLPWVAVSFKGPAYSDEQKDKPALDLISSLGFSQTSELYQKLVIKEQKVDTILADFEDHRDPYLVTVVARVKDPKDIEYTKAEIIKAFDSYKTTTVPEDKLNAVKSNLKYGFALSLDNSEAIAAGLAPYISLKRTPETLNKLYDLYAAITPRTFSRWLRSISSSRSARRSSSRIRRNRMRVSNRLAVFSATLILAVAAPGIGLARAGKASSSMASVLLPSSSPLVSFRFLFNVGSASDPKGKEGVAALTASMISDGGSRVMSYEQISAAMYPMATGFGSQVDKEMTVFAGTTHRDNLQKYGMRSYLDDSRSGFSRR